VDCLSLLSQHYLRETGKPEKPLSGYLVTLPRFELGTPKDTNINLQCYAALTCLDPES
jgi:hypothetical protein